MEHKKPVTWAEEREKLEKMLGELPHITWEAMRRAGAGHRHAERVAYVADLALAGKTGDDRGSVALFRTYHHSWENTEAIASTMSHLLGRGSDDDLENVLYTTLGECIMVQDAWNERPGWGAKLGKGRAKATDGGAYTAAIQEVTEQIGYLVYVLSDGDLYRSGSLHYHLAVKTAGQNKEWKAHAIEWLSRELATWERSLVNSMVFGEDHTARRIASYIRELEGIG